MDLEAVMDEIGTALETISGLHVYPYPVGALSPPAALVQFPTINFDRAFQRGTDIMDGGIMVVVSQVWDRAARAAIAPYCAGSGAKSVHAALRGSAWTTCSFARALRVTFPPGGYTVGEVPYVGAQFDLQIAGPGS